MTAVVIFARQYCFSFVLLEKRLKYTMLHINVPQIKEREKVWKVVLDVF